MRFGLCAKELTDGVKVKLFWRSYIIIRESGSSQDITGHRSNYQMKGTNKSEALRGRRDQVGCRDQERLHGRGGWCAKPLAFITT